MAALAPAAGRGLATAPHNSAGTPYVQLDIESCCACLAQCCPALQVERWLRVAGAAHITASALPKEYDG
jgi:hypothetical protein